MGRSSKAAQSQALKGHVLTKAKTKERLLKKLAVKTGKKTICLTMIVKNESKNMVRLLDSVKSIIDFISIVDTGSEDNTEEIILNWSKEHKIPTTVHHEPFVNFEYNRTQSVQIAKKTYPEADYLLLSDADFVWEVNVGQEFDKVLLIDHKYLIKQYNPSIQYDNVRLLSNKVDWECIMDTHEYWAEALDQNEYMGEVRVGLIKTLKIHDMEDGGCKADKFERDIRLLKNVLERETEKRPGVKSRAKFYLAQTYKDIGEHELSIEWYQKRIEAGGWPEEVYYSKFQIGYNYEQLGWKTREVIRLLEQENTTEEELQYIEKNNKHNYSIEELKQKMPYYFNMAVKNYNSAHKYRPSRREALYYNTRLHRMLALNQQAYDLAKIGQKVKPCNDSLFLETGCYESWYWDYEISIVSFYLDKHKDESRKTIGKLISMIEEDPNKYPEWFKNSVFHNSRIFL